MCSASDTHMASSSLCAPRLTRMWHHHQCGYAIRFHPVFRMMRLGLGDVSVHHHDQRYSVHQRCFIQLRYPNSASLVRQRCFIPLVRSSKSSRLITGLSEMFHSTERPLSVQSTITKVFSSSEMFQSTEIPEQCITGSPAMFHSTSSF